MFANGVHTLVARAYTGATLLGASGGVTVTVDNGPPPVCADEYEPNDRSPDAKPLALGVPVTAYISTPADADWFRVDVSSPGALTFDLAVPAANDFDLELYGPDAAYLSGSYANSGLAERITHSAIEAGRYWVRVYGYPAGNGSHNTTAPYTLTAGSTIGPITILTQPTDRTLPAGACGSFTVAAAGAPPLAYQWQRSTAGGGSFSDIPGATTPTYATPSLTLADTAAQFRVRISNAFGSVVSAPTTLTVTSPKVITWTDAAGDGDWFNRTNWNPMSVPTGSDGVLINGGSLSVPAGAKFGILDLAGGSLGGAWTNAGTMRWTGGALGGQLVNGVGSVLLIEGAEDKVFNNYQRSDVQLVNEGTLIWSGTGRLLSAGDTFYGSLIPVENRPGGVWEIQSDSTIEASPGNYVPRLAIFNRGLLRKTDGAGVTGFGSVVFDNSGTVEVHRGTLSFANGFGQISGETRLAGGALGGGTFTLSGGKLTGSGTINASVVNSARVSPGLSAGTLTINGDYTQTAAGVLEVELGGVAPGSGYDQLIVNGQASLAGVLDVRLLSGLNPAFGDAFAVLTCGSQSGGFGTVNLPSLSAPLSFTVNESPAGVTLAVTRATDQPVNTLEVVATEGNALELRFVGEAGRIYRLQASSDLVEWVDVSAEMSAGGLIEYSDSHWRSRARSFYRVVAQ